MESARQAAVPLTRRERQVAMLVAEGLTNRQIAERMYIGERTAEGHVERIRNKLGFHSRAQIATWVASQRIASSPIATPRSELELVLPPERRRKSSWARQPLRVAATVAIGGVLVAALLLLRSTPPPTPTIVTVAGIGRDGFSGDSGPATDAQLAQPTAVVVDASTGVIYVSDSLNAAVRAVDRNGTITTVAGRGASPPMEGGYGFLASLGMTGPLASDGAGSLYLTGARAGLLRLAPDLRLHQVSADSDPSLAGDVGGLAVDQAGNLYFTETATNRVRKVDVKGVISTVAGTGERGYSGDGGAALGARLAGPEGLALDRRGNLYIADTINHRVRVVSPDGIIRTVAGSSGQAGFAGDGSAAVSARLSFPRGVAVDRIGSLYISDTGNNRVRRVDGRGVIATVAGNGRQGDSGDSGPADAAQLSGPIGLAFDSTGNLYIADSLNNRIRMLRLPPGNGR